MKNILVLLSVIILFSSCSTLVNHEIFIPYRKADKWGICNQEKDFYVLPEYDRIYPVDADLFIAVKKNLYGVINAHGEIVIPFEYQEIILTRDGETLRVKKRGRHSYMTKLGKELLPSKYSNPAKAGRNLYRVRSPKYGFVDSLMNVVIPPKYDQAEVFRDSLSLVGINKKYGYINMQGKTVINNMYDYGYSFMTGKAAVKLNGKYGLIDKNNTVLIPFEYDYIGVHTNGIIVLQKDNKFGLLNENLKPITALDLEKKPERKENYFKLKKGAYAMINSDGDTILPFMYQDVQFPGEDLFPVKYNNKWGFVNEKNEVVIPAIYKGVKRFTEGLAAAHDGTGWGYINKQNDLVIPYTFKEANPFNNGGAGVKDFKNRKSWLTKDGRTVIPFKYNEISGFKHGIAEIRIWDYSTGKEIIKAGYVDENFNDYFED